MPFHLRIIPQLDLIASWCEGVVTLSDAIGYFQDLAVHPHYRPGQADLMDLSRVDQIDIPFTAMLQISRVVGDLYATHGAPGRTAYYAPGEMAFGMARMYQSISTDGPHPESAVFGHREAALKFLGLDPALTLPGPGTGDAAPVAARRGSAVPIRTDKLSCGL